MSPLSRMSFQDRDLQEKVRNSGGVPIFTLKSKVPHLEPPSERSRDLANRITQSRSLPEHSKDIIVGIKRAKDEADEEPSKKRKKRAQGPHPLSCLSKKSKPVEKRLDGKKARKRRRGKKTHEDIPTRIKTVTRNSENP